VTDAPHTPQGPPSGGPPRAAPGPAGDADDEVVEAELVDDADTEGEAFGAGQAGSADPADSSADADADLEAAAAAVEVDLELLLAERAEFLGAYRRTQADFENYRKQSQRRLDDAVVRSLGNFVEGLLPVLDACDAAVAHGAAQAVDPILTALYGALEKEGLERIDPTGKPFDPAEADAVMHEPGDGGAQVVAATMRTGYRWRGRVLRPAMVKVTD
jgi:molecular chaperone GrpE